MMVLPSADFSADEAVAAGWDKDLPMKISMSGSRLMEPSLLPSPPNHFRGFYTAWGAGVLPLAGEWGWVRKEGRKSEWDDEEVHTAVPSLSSSDDEALSQPPPGLPQPAGPRAEAPPTTVMMRNIPVEYTRSALVQLLDEAGFYGSYNLVYLPMNFRTLQGFGYAFVNLSSPQDAKSLCACFNGFCAWRVESDKRCEVSWSNTLQGLQAHVERYRNSPLMHPSVPDEFKPARYEGSGRVPFPEPTKRVKAPRHRKVGGECDP